MRKYRALNVLFQWFLHLSSHMFTFQHALCYIEAIKLRWLPFLPNLCCTPITVNGQPLLSGQFSKSPGRPLNRGPTVLSKLCRPKATGLDNTVEPSFATTSLLIVCLVGLEARNSSQTSSSPLASSNKTFSVKFVLVRVDKVDGTGSGTFSRWPRLQFSVSLDCFEVDGEL